MLDGGNLVSVALQDSAESCRPLPPAPAGLAAHSIVFLGYATIKLIIIIDCVGKAPLPNCWGRVNSSRDGAMLPFGGNKKTPLPSGLGLRISRYSTQHRSTESYRAS